MRSIFPLIGRRHCPRGDAGAGGYEAAAAGSHESSATRIQALLADRAAITHPEPQRAIAFALELVAAAAGELILYRCR